jgi:TRAP-type C4-dicarboxylate transport system permease small subunit
VPLRAAFGPAWTEEIARILYIWVVFFGMVVVESENRGIRTTYFLARMNKTARLVLLTVMDIACIAFCFVIFLRKRFNGHRVLSMQIGSFNVMTGAVIYMPSCIAPCLWPFILGNSW